MAFSSEATRRGSRRGGEAGADGDLRAQISGCEANVVAFESSFSVSLLQSRFQSVYTLCECLKSSKSRRCCRVCPATHGRGTFETGMSSLVSSFHNSSVTYSGLMVPPAVGAGVLHLTSVTLYSVICGGLWKVATTWTAQTDQHVERCHCVVRQSGGSSHLCAFKAETQR